MTAAAKAEFLNYLDGYKLSVGCEELECDSYIHQSLASSRTAELATRLLELLKVLSRLSPDPDTVNTALMFVAHTITGTNLPEPESKVVGRLMEELLRLHRMQAEQLESSRAASAEGLRRLLLALVKDVRVVLIALAWRLVVVLTGPQFA